METFPVTCLVTFQRKAVGTSFYAKLAYFSGKLGRRDGRSRGERSRMSSCITKCPASAIHFSIAWGHFLVTCSGVISHNNVVQHFKVNEWEKVLSGLVLPTFSSGKLLFQVGSLRCVCLGGQLAIGQRA